MTRKSAKRIMLDNGITVLYNKTNSHSVTVEVMVRVGSNYESARELGMAHFIEHMLFEGTKKRATSREITNEIEKLGGDFNAYTTSERTAFYVKVLGKHFARVVEVLSDCFLHSTFSPKIIAKEKKVVLKEIHMVHDDPRFYQWIFFQKHLFKKHPTRISTLGTEKTVTGFTRKMIVDYFKKHYVGPNIIISVVGNVDDPTVVLKKTFGRVDSSNYFNDALGSEGPNTKQETFIEKRKTMSAYMILGYKAPLCTEYDSYVFDVIEAILGKGQSGWIFDEVRNKRGLAYEVGVHHDATIDHGVFAVQASTDKKNVKKATQLVLNCFKKLQTISASDIREAKGHIEGSYLVDMEDTYKLADQLAFWELQGNVTLAESYISKIKRVTKKDIVRVAKQYLTDKFTRVIVAPK